MEKELSFFETILKLSDETREMEVVAIGSYLEHEKWIGIRSGSAPADIEFHDPMIGGVHFMICGEIRFKGNYKEIVTDLDAMKGRLVEDCIVDLRAVPSIVVPGLIQTSVDLGTYRIEKEEVVTEGEWYSDLRIKLTLKRIGT